MNDRMDVTPETVARAREIAREFREEFEKAHPHGYARQGDINKALADFTATMAAQLEQRMDMQQNLYEVELNKLIEKINEHTSRLRALEGKTE